MYIVITISPTEDGIEDNYYTFATLEAVNDFIENGLDYREEVYEIIHNN